jgi:hypothetical protein
MDFCFGRISVLRYDSCQAELDVERFLTLEYPMKRGISLTLGVVLILADSMNVSGRSKPATEGRFKTSHF